MLSIEYKAWCGMQNSMGHSPQGYCNLVEKTVPTFKRQNWSIQNKNLFSAVSSTELIESTIGIQRTTLQQGVVVSVLTRKLLRRWMNWIKSWKISSCPVRDGEEKVKVNIWRKARGQRLERRAWLFREERKSEKIAKWTVD